MEKDYSFVCKRLGENVAQLRKASGYSQMQFAKILGVSQSVISAWEKAEREMSLATIWRIADIFKTPVTTLLPIAESENANDIARSISDKVQTEPKWKLLFEKLDDIGPRKLDAILALLDAML